LWELLGKAVRRVGDERDSRFVVGDSKMVYAQGGGLDELERSTHTALLRPAAKSCAQLIEMLSPDCHDELRREAWYDGATVLPTADPLENILAAMDRLTRSCRQLGICWGPVRSVVICPAAFNAMIDRWDSKGAVLTTALHRLLACVNDLKDEGVAIFIDKHGGRNNYAGLLQPAFPEGLVLALEECSSRSAYEVAGGTRVISLTIEPRADGSHFCVALASMVSKYLREVLMLEFNRFWQAKVPGLKPTAGYPSDSRRFWKVIRPIATKMGLPADTLWRRR
jgi:ribonuclease HII